MTKGISHMTFIVSDLEKATVFFKTIFNAKEVYYSGDDTFSLSREKFFMIENLWIVIMEGEKIDRSYNHIAFKIDDSDFDMYYKKIKDLGLEINEGRSRVEGEGKSIYFYDFDNHLFELHTGTLEERLHRYNN